LAWPGQKYFAVNAIYMANSEATVAEACGINLRTANEQLLNFFQQTMTGLTYGAKCDGGIVE